jgi:hypothetical protein
MEFRGQLRQGGRSLQVLGQTARYVVRKDLPIALGLSLKQSCQNRAEQPVFDDGGGIYAGCVIQLTEKGKKGVHVADAALWQSRDTVHPNTVGEVDVKIRGAFADLGGTLEQSPSLNVVLASGQLNGNPVFRKAKDSSQHDQKNITGVHSGDMPLMREKLTESRQTEGGNVLHGKMHRHNGYLLVV